jgi:hypothetical protein
LASWGASRGFLACAVLAIGGCAPALPSFAGGRTVPAGRSDLALGGAIRVPVGGLVASEPGDDSDRLLAFGGPGGVAPAAFVRHGLGPNADLGAEVTGSSAHFTLRGQLRLPSGLRVVAGLAPHVGYVGGDGDAVRAGGTIPLVLAIDLFSIYELWLGVRVGLEHVVGDLGPDGALESVSLTGLRTGGVVGLAVGFRRVWVLVELAVDHELWTGSLGDNPIERNGVVLTPAFAFRLRL